MFQADENPPFNTRPASDADAGPALRHSELKRQSASNLSYSLRHHFSDRFHALGRGVGVNNGSAVARNFSGGKGAAFENADQNFFNEFAQLIATLRRHHHVQFWTARGVTHLVVFEPRQ